jgi:hypothetical protein
LIKRDSDVDVLLFQDAKRREEQAKQKVIIKIQNETKDIVSQSHINKNSQKIIVGRFLQEFEAVCAQRGYAEYS